ncbi:MAG TPA: DUF4231 domain-containing protein [Chloroflexia bacterium]|nr:DUF4231 domain-containing protein [Chloroflexia bacterium]
MTNYDEARNEAIKYCKDLIDWYERVKRQDRFFHVISQSAVIMLSAITPVLILWTELPKVIQALPAAIVAIIIGLSGIFQWRDNYVRNAYTAEKLKLEQLKFQTRTTKDYSVNIDERMALDNFVSRVEALTTREVSEWRRLMLDGQDSDEASKQPDSDS